MSINKNYWQDDTSLEPYVFNYESVEDVHPLLDGNNLKMIIHAAIQQRVTPIQREIEIQQREIQRQQKEIELLKIHIATKNKKFYPVKEKMAVSRIVTTEEFINKVNNFDKVASRPSMQPATLKATVAQKHLPHKTIYHHAPKKKPVSIPPKTD